MYLAKPLRRKGFYPRIITPVGGSAYRLTLIHTNYINTFYYNYKKLEKIREIRGQNLFFVCLEASGRYDLILI